MPAKKPPREKFTVSVDGDVSQWADKIGGTIFGSKSKLVEVALKRLRKQIEEEDLTIDELLGLYEDDS